MPAPKQPRKPRTFKCWVRASAEKILREDHGYIVACTKDFVPLDNEPTVEATLTLTGKGRNAED